MFTGSAFEKRLENKNCYGARHGEYTSINAAMDVCITDSNCFAIMDYLCDGTGVAYLCNANPKKIYTDSSNCIYVRTGNILKGGSYRLIVIGKCKFT